MVNPYARAFLRMCLTRWEASGQQWQDTFLDLRVDNVVLDQGQFGKDDEAVWVVPAKGALTFTFVLRFRDEKEAHNPGTLLCDAYKAGRPVLSLGHFRRMLEVWGGCGSDEVRALVIVAVLQDFHVTAAMVRKMCQVAKSYTFRDAIVRAALPQLLDPHDAVDLVQHLQQPVSRTPPSPHRLRHLRYFFADNATGRYALDMQSPADVVVAETLFYLNQWEAAAEPPRERRGL